MKKNKIKVLCCILTLSIVVGISTGCTKGGTSKDSKAAVADTKKKDNSAKLSKSIKSKDSVAQFNVPESWSEMDSLNPVANLQVGNLKEEKYLLNISEKKTSFSDSMTLKDYYNIITQNMSTAVVNANLTDPKEITINGNKALQFELSGEVEKIKVSYLITIIDAEKHFHQVLTWTLMDKFNEYKGEYSDIVNTFKEM